MEVKSAYLCQFCGGFYTDAEDMAHTKDDGSYNMCWQCWDKTEEDKEEALAALDNNNNNRG
jgi:hypothetical protein